ncbi:DUF4142 domain-containing protein [Hymenobacter weizhouensis]|uniref:DUF4142 domain-containing protein n=1 Tax=Hymenobacter sp. YIM 151500-1 TaxID=2987689 RepID=UPI0022271912|nr:DUF4142 domain-containing protein [Hymenobacter sp. YIM 151500-1]UYZ62056.1 DUF4142 domain-containing protein [Hymenobacter sp. YIM 151500-1]
MLVARWTGLLLLPLLVACSGGESNKDPVAEAKFQNEKRIGEQDITEKQQRDAEFVVNAASRGMLLLEISQIALRKATSPAVKTLAQTIVSQHTGLQQEVKTLAAQKSIVLPSALGKDQGEQAGELTALNGPAFDTRYLEQLEKLHEQSIDDYDDMSEDAYDGDIRALAARQLAQLKQHLEAAEQVQDQLKK